MSRLATAATAATGRHATGASAHDPTVAAAAHPIAAAAHSVAASSRLLVSRSVPDHVRWRLPLYLPSAQPARGRVCWSKEQRVRLPTCGSLV